MRKSFQNALFGALALSLALAAGGGDSNAATPASPGNGLKLERVVMLMRHGIRPPTKNPALPAGYAADPWPSWPVAAGELTPRGALGIGLLGTADRAAFVERGLLPAQGCPADGAIAAAASAKSRAINTAKAYLAALVPGCAVTLDHPSKEGLGDIIFHPLDAQSDSFDGHLAWQQAMALAPAGGIAAEQTAHRSELELLQKALDCCSVPVCKTNGLKTGCTLTDLPGKLVEQPHDRPKLEGPLDIASTASQTFLLEYLEGMPMADVAWGRLDRGQIETLLRFHPVKFRYNNRPDYIAQHAAGPIAHRMLDALNAKPGSSRLLLLSGHDTNLADLGSLLDLTWHVASYPQDDIPPGSVLGFELLSDASGKQFVRAFFRAQTMDQLRSLTPLGGDTQPYRAYLAIPGCGNGGATECTLERFNTVVDGKLGVGTAAAQ